ncbi:MAG: ISNCY family transposase [Candidatus Omnitrophica bacterium]|nr:ISNCY family transposase [Candidatus Omnitrophota bacterium]
MAGRDIITMSQKELKRLHVVHKIFDKKLKQVDAVGILGLCGRQIGRIVARIRKEGDRGIIHKSRSKPSNRTLPKKLKDKVIRLYRQKYPDFGPRFANEKLFEIDKIRIGDQTLRNWLIEDGVWQVTHKRRKYRRWRERKHHFGQMTQVDGSHHDWFEGRGPECVLMGHIDDATSKRFAGFCEYEGTLPFMDSFKRYIKRYGIPQSVYIDRHTTYKSTAKPSIEDELNNREPLTQVGRALEQLGVEVIYAHSAPAKGRIERSFKTFQDRLIKEMRLRNINAIDGANRFLKAYLPVFNKRFSVKPIEEGNLHRPLPENIDLDKILCKKTERTLRNDFTVAHDKKLYQVLERINAKKVTVEERTNGKMLITYKDKPLKYKQIIQRPAKTKPEKQYTPKPKKPYIPPKDHPYKSFKVSPYTHINSYPQKEKVGQKEKELLLVH